MQQNYEVIRFVGQNGRYHIVMDSVEGELLSNYLQKQTSMSKLFFLTLITNIAKELEGLEGSNAIEYIPYLTPFHIVLKEDQSVSFLKSSEKYNKKMEKAVECFITADGTGNFYYSYGRILQYILMKMKLRPRLSKLEEYRLRKIISKCMCLDPKKQYKNVKEITARLSTMKKNKKRAPIMFMILGSVLLGSVAIRKEPKVIPEAINEDPYEQLMKYMEGELPWSETEVERFLKEYKAEKQEDFELAEREWIMKLCYQLDTDFARQELKTQGNYLLDELFSMRELMASIDMEEGNLEAALQKYHVLLLESPSAERYIALIDLYAQRLQYEEAVAYCEIACEKFPDREDLQLRYIKYLFLEETMDLQKKQEKLKLFLDCYPMLKESEAFDRLIQELGIEEAAKDE